MAKIAAAVGVAVLGTREPAKAVELALRTEIMNAAAKGELESESLKLRMELARAHAKGEA